MSTISRRDFMKTAGVMTLAVAASAALAGCSADPASSEAEVIKTSTNTAAIGDHTITITTKLYKVAEYSDTKTEAANKVASEVEHLYVLVADDRGSKEKSYYDFSSVYAKVTGMLPMSAGKTLTKDVFGTELKTTVAPNGYITSNPTMINGVAYYCFGYVVNKVLDGSFATPTYDLVFTNNDKKSYTTISAPIDAATAIDLADYKKIVKGYKD